MRLVITPSLQCVSVSSTRSKLAVKAVSPVSGQPERHRCWRSNTRKLEAATKTDDCSSVFAVSHSG